MRVDLVRYLRNRTKFQNQSNIICTHGKKGSGKSYICLRLAELIDKNFSIDRVVFTPLELYRVLKSKPPRGSVIIFEEIGTSANARDAQSKTNKHLSFINQVWRTKNLTVIFNTPLISFVDKQIRNLFDFEITPIMYDGKLRLSKFKFVQNFPNSRGYDPIQKHLIFKIDDKPAKIIEWVVRIPSEPLRLAYEEKRSIYLDQIIDDGLMTLESGVEHRAGKRQKAEPAKQKEALYDTAQKVKADPSCFINGKPNAILIGKKYNETTFGSLRIAALINAELKAKRV